MGRLSVDSLMKAARIRAAKQGEFYVIEKCYAGTWAPLWMDMRFTKADADEMVRERQKNFPKEKLRVATYVRKE